MGHAFGSDIENPDFGSHDHETVLGHHVAGGTETITIEHRSDDRAVRKSNRSGPIPRFDQTTMVLVESALGVAHGEIVLPSFGDHHHDGMGKRAAGVVKQLEGVVEHGRITAGRIEHRQNCFHVVEQGRREDALAGAHPVDVAAQSVDFTVMGHEPVGVGAIPGRERIGAEALVDQSQCAGELLVAQIQVELRNLLGQQQPLVAHGSGRETGDVEGVFVRQVGFANCGFDPLTDDEELALQRRLIINARTAGDENLPDLRRHLARHLTAR